MSHVLLAKANDREAELARIKQLMGNDGSKPKAVILNSSLCEGFRCDNGKVYAIVRESNKYYLKESTKNYSTDPLDFTYLGGAMNKSVYCFESFASAKKSFKSFLSNKRVSGVLLEQTSLNPEQEQPMPDPTAAPAPTEAPMDATAPSPEGGESPMGDAGSGDMEDTGDVGDMSGDEGVDEMEKIDSLLGKMSYELRNTEVTNDKTLSILKTMISALPINDLSQDEKFELIKAIKKGKSDVKAYELAGGEEETGGNVETVDSETEMSVEPKMPVKAPTAPKKDEFSENFKFVNRLMESVGKGKKKVN